MPLAKYLETPKPLSPYNIFKKKPKNNGGKGNEDQK
jgi:hypothetical protein